MKEPIDRWDYRDSEILCKLPKITKLINGGAHTWTHNDNL